MFLRAACAECAYAIWYQDQKQFTVRYNRLIETDPRAIHKGAPLDLIKP